MSAALFELAVHYGMELYSGDAEKRQKYIDWFIENHELAANGIVFKPKIMIMEPGPYFYEQKA